MSSLYTNGALYQTKPCGWTTRRPQWDEIVNESMDSENRSSRRGAVIGSGRRGHCDGASHQAALHRPYGVCGWQLGDASALIFTDCFNNALRLVTFQPRSPTASSVYTIQCDALLKPKGLCLSDDKRYLFLCDTGHHRIKFAALPLLTCAVDGVLETESRRGSRISRSIELFSFAGSGEKGWKDGPVQESCFNAPVGICECSDGTIFVADTGNHCIRAIRRSSRLEGGLTVTTIAGGRRATSPLPSGQSRAGHKDGISNEALFRSPTVVIEGLHGELLVADTMNHCIRALVRTTVNMTEVWTVSTVCGRPQRSGYLDGACARALFTQPIALCKGPHGTVFVSDGGNKRIRQIGTSASAGTRLSSGYLSHAYTWVRTVDTSDGIARPICRQQERIQNNHLMLGMAYVAPSPRKDSKQSDDQVGSLWLCNATTNVVEQVTASEAWLQTKPSQAKSTYQLPEKKAPAPSIADSDSETSSACSYSAASERAISLSMFQETQGHNLSTWESHEFVAFQAHISDEIVLYVVYYVVSADAAKYCAAAPECVVAATVGANVCRGSL